MHIIIRLISFSMPNIANFFTTTTPVRLEPGDIPCDQTVLNAVNAAISETPKRSRKRSYNHFTAQDRLEIAELVRDEGPTKAARKFSTKHDVVLTESTARSIEKQWKREAAKTNCYDMDSLPKKSGASTKLPSEIDNLVVQVILNTISQYISFFVVVTDITLFAFERCCRHLWYC